MTALDQAYVAEAIGTLGKNPTERNLSLAARLAGHLDAPEDLRDGIDKLFRAVSSLSLASIRASV
jgi:hypothetical protein